MKARVWVGVLIAFILGAGAYYLNMDRAPELPEGFARGNGRVEGVQIDIVSRIAGRVENVDVI